MGATPARKADGRAMTSDVYWTLLGLIIERPSYGLELHNRHQRVYGDVLPISSGAHIYTGLNEMEKRGLIEIVPGVGGGRQPKPRYRATPLGVRSFEDWCVERIDALQRGYELWTRQLAIFAPDPAAAIEILRRFRGRYAEKAGQTGAERTGSVKGSRDALIDCLVAEQQRIATGGMLSWLQFAIAKFEDRVGSVADDDPPAS
jgi:DNA-binding PadR family transcriptional regulator